jgi:hypothetical protein
VRPLIYKYFFVHLNQKKERKEKKKRIEKEEEKRMMIKQEFEPQQHLAHD